MIPGLFDVMNLHISYQIKPCRIIHHLSSNLASRCEIDLMEEIPDDKITASSTQATITQPQMARLQTVTFGEESGAWVPEVNNEDQFLQVGTTHEVSNSVTFPN